MADIPQVEIPFPGFYKVVQFDVGGRPYLRFGQRGGGDYHVLIVHAFASELGVEALVVDVCNTTRVLLPQSAGKIVGAGLCGVENGTTKSLRFSEFSQVYSLGINRKHIESLSELLEGFELFF
jgi:hypothetical protein